MSNFLLHYSQFHYLSSFNRFSVSDLLIYLDELHVILLVIVVKWWHKALFQSLQWRKTPTYGVVASLLVLANTNPIIELSEVHITRSCYCTCRPDLICSEQHEHETSDHLQRCDLSESIHFFDITSYFIILFENDVVMTADEVERQFSSVPWRRDVFNPERSTDQSCTKR